MISPDEFKILNYINIRQAIEDPNVISSMVEMQPARAKELFDSCVKVGYILEADGMWQLTESGEEAVSQFRKLEVKNKERELEAIYERFDKENSIFKRIVSEWQAERDDQKALEGLEGVHIRISEIFQELSRLIPRYEIYPSRFNKALKNFKDGKTEYLAKYSVDSYHTIWFELHEDLLNLLGKEREEWE